MNDPLVFLGVAGLVAAGILLAVMSSAVLWGLIVRYMAAQTFRKYPIDWSSDWNLEEEKTLDGIVAEADLEVLQSDLLESIAVREELRAEAETQREAAERERRAKRRHWATVRRLRATDTSGVEVQVQELPGSDQRKRRVPKVST